ncbi:two-component system response regulator [Hyella patelloides]|uniref:two-component system response regulator n=1 Tax=Hyella patelloides TaxID=1982969 RepID=UPI00164398BC|nr:EAL domain-containing protein [Hyella patelloides]
METSANQYHKANILIVDDTSSNLRLLSKLLQDEGYAVRCALDGATALTIAEAEWPDIILLDIVMPEMDGYEICQQLKISEKTQQIPVIFFSNLEDVFDKQKAFDVGGVDYIPKSFNSLEVIIRIEHQLTIQSAKAEIIRLNTELEDRVKERTQELEVTNQKLQQEINQRQQVQDAMIRQALQDSLTGLANRNAFISKVKKAIKQKQSNNNYQYAIFLLECDRFKYVKHNYGYIEANRFLIALSNQITTCFSESACISRFEGDDFAILVDSFTELKIIKDLAKNVQEKLQQPFNIQEEKMKVSNCLGVALGNQQYLEVDHLLHDANLAMQVSKNQTIYQIFDTKKHSLFKGYNKKKLDIEAELKRAIDNNEFIVHYQPIISLATGKITELEAFIRWNHPQKGMVFPSSFIASAEETGLIIPMGDLVILEACKTIVKLQKEHDLNLKVSIDLSPAQFHQPNLVKKIKQIIDATGIKGEDLQLEMPEKAIYQNPELTIKYLNELKESRVGVGISDFGYGHSPLTYLALTYLISFSVSRVKIDSNLLQQDTQEKSDYNFQEHDIYFCEQLISLSRQINVPVIVKNLRFNKQLKYFKDLQCKFGQGILISKVLDPKALEELLLWSTF